MDLGTLPADVFAGQTFHVTASLFNPHATTTDPALGGQTIEHARLRLTVHAENGALSAGQLSAVADDGQVPFTAGDDGNLVGWWGPETGFPVPPGYHASTTFHVTVADGAPVGPYHVTLELVDLDAPDAVTPKDDGTFQVHPDEMTLLWGGEVPAVATQGSYVAIPLRVHSPEAGTAEIELGISGPTDTVDAGDVAVYGSNADGNAMTKLELAADDTGRLGAAWPVSVPAGDTDLVWYLLVAPGAPEGGYALDAGLAGGTPLDPVVIAMSAPETHGESPSAAVKITVISVGTDPSFTLTAVPADTTGTFQCRLGVDGADAAWEQDCGTPPSADKSYSDLGPGTYEFSARLKLGSSRMSEVASVTWVVPDDGTTTPPDGEDTTAPSVTIAPTGVPGSTATFTLTADDPTASLTCRMYEGTTARGAWTACEDEVTYTGLEPGTYTLDVRATDPAGNESEIASTQWTVVATPPSGGGDDTTPPSGGGDTTPPSTGGGDTVAPSLVVTPTGVLASTATFALTSDDPTATFTCRLATDGTAGEWEPCDSTVTYQALEPGSYLFEARATDPAGNVSTVATRQWAVGADSGGRSTAPRTSVVGGPRNHAWVLAHSATFRLRSDAPDARFRVRVNAGPVRTCAAGSCRVTGLVAGTNRIRFAAVAQGMVDRTPVTRFVTVPRGVLALRHEQWRIGQDTGALFGRYAQTRTRHRTLSVWAPQVKRVALVVSTGPRAGAVDVYLGNRRLTRTPVRLATRTRHRQVVVPIATFAQAQRGRLRVVVVSRHRAVRIEGLAVATR